MPFHANRTRTRMRAGRKPDATTSSLAFSERPAPDGNQEAPVVAAVPLLQANERDAVRALRNAAEVALLLLSSSSLGDDVAEYVGDFVKPHFDAAAWELRRLLGVEE